MHDFLMFKKQTCKRMQTVSTIIAQPLCRRQHGLIRGNAKMNTATLFSVYGTQTAKGMQDIMGFSAMMEAQPSVGVQGARLLIFKPSLRLGGLRQVWTNGKGVPGRGSKSIVIDYGKSRDGGKASDAV